MSEQNKTFTEELNEFQEIVNKLRDDDLPLEENMELFKRGTELSKVLRGKLHNYELEIIELKKDIETDL